MFGGKTRTVMIRASGKMKNITKHTSPIFYCATKSRMNLRNSTFAPISHHQRNFCSNPSETEAVVSPISRTQVTAEVIISKIFPAGFGWQTFSLIAEGTMMLSPESAGFALMTGLGDAIGVYVGHTTLYKIKEAIGTKVDMKQEHQIGRWLASAAFLSGTAWQPTVNALAGMGLGFTGAAAATTMVCGGCFFVGLRMGRSVYSVGRANPENLPKDAMLGLSIGGATGAFVGTDISFAGNWLRPVVGIEEGMSNLAGMCTAGTSTGLGFAAFQGVQNAVVPAKKSWNDA